MSSETARYQPGSPAERGMSLGTVLFGLIMVALGILWLLDVSGVVDVTWTFVSAVMLILVGVSLIVGAREGSHGGLVFLGVVLSIIVLLGSLVSLPAIGGGLGDRVTQPETLAEVEEQYRWGMGSDRYDFRAIEFPEGETRIGLQVGMGNLEVDLPEDVAVRIEYQVGVGDFQALGRSQSGFGIEGVIEQEGYPESDRQLRIEIQVGMGAVEVRQ